MALKCNHRNCNCMDNVIGYPQSEANRTVVVPVAGKSAYEIWKIYNPDSTWSEAEWLENYVRGGVDVGTLVGLYDVNIISPTNGQSLVWNSSTLNWENATVSGGGDGTWGSITGDLPDQADLQDALNDKQNVLVSGTNIKTINGATILGNGNIDTPNTTYTASNGITISGSNVISPVYGTTAGTMVEGNDSRLNNNYENFEI